MSALPAPARLEALESVIERGLETFVEVGQALTEIRDLGLYPQRTFEDYCRERWDFSGSRARQLMAAAETVTNVTVGGLPTPSSEGVTRALVPLRSEPEALREVWAETVERHGDKPTAAQVREVAARKDRERKERGTERREAKRAEDAAAPTEVANLHHADFREAVATLDDASVALLLTDPPYGADYKSGYRWASEHRAIDGDAAIDDALALFSDALRLLEPKLATDAHLLVFCRWREEPLFRDAVLAAGWTLRSGVVWVKNEPGMGDLAHSFGPQHERVLHATRGEAVMRYRESDTITCARVVSSDHPTEKPVALLERLVRATTNPGDLVADPFAGVASTLVAASTTGRRGWGCEIDNDYFAAGAERLAA